MKLTAADFREFYAEVRGVEPFPWQAGVVERVLGEGRWPDLVDVPTGLGKTSMLDVAVFVAAATADVPGAGRVGRRRCLFVVDRRVVVDDAYRHAVQLAERLAAAERDGEEGVVGAVAAGLRRLAPGAGGDVLVVTRMRGGVTWDQAWLERPDQPGVVIGTVDQVGSRFLFRGYGVSDRRRPIDAALVGTDALLLLDEAHLATALTITIEAGAARDRLGLPLPGLDVVRLSATAEQGERPYELDVAEHLAHVEAGRRLQAPKALRLAETTSAQCAAVMAQHALTMAAGAPSGATSGWAPAVLVVANTVDRARAVHALLERQLAVQQPAEGAAEVSLLIGRSRPVDREGLAEVVRDRFGVGRRPAARPVVLVATQTVEVGVNLDVDRLVTESASWDALVQRLGRLNRLGRHQDRFPGAGPAAAIAVHDGQADGPVYGPARDVTWAHLSRVSAAAAPGQGIGVSPLQCRHLAAAVPDGAAAARRAVPVLQVPTLDAWACTGPVPQGDPPVDVFIHGFGTGPAGVAIAWRAGLDDPDRPGMELDAGAAGAVLQAVPVRAGEQVEVPLAAVRRWMEGLAVAAVGDLETAAEVPEPGTGRARRGREPFRALVWRSGDDAGPGAAGGWVWTPADGVRPGDQLVVPAGRGGLDRYGWAPASVEPVVDVSEPASFAGRRPRPVLRLDPELGHRLGLGERDARAVAAAVRRISAVDQQGQDLEDDAADLAPQLLDVLAAGLGRGLAAAEDGLPAPVLAGCREEVRRWLAGRPRVVAVVDPAAARHAAEDGEVEAPRVVQYLLVGGRGVGVERDDESSASSSAGLAPVGLGRHLGAVRARAGQIAAALGLPAEVAAVVEDAAGWHDAGKVEDRFQIMLHGDELLAVLAEEPLAKSGLAPGDRSAWRAARARSGLPAGARHEAWSAALVEAYLAQLGAGYPGDGELLVHLVASHHGHARPWLPLVVDDAARPVEYVFDDGLKVSVSSAATVSLEHPARFAQLNARYGRWGLALLEAVVRCADMTVSAEGS